MITPYYKSPSHDFNLICGDTFELLPQFNFKFDMIFADPPYFLSSGGISVQSGKVVCVDKGDWDKSMSQEDINAFNLKWLSLCREKLKDNGFDVYASEVTEGFSKPAVFRQEAFPRSFFFSEPMLFLVSHPIF